MFFIWRGKERGRGEKGGGRGRGGEEKAMWRGDARGGLLKPLSLIPTLSSLNFATRKSLQDIRKVTYIPFSSDELNP